MRTIQLKFHVGIHLHTVQTTLFHVGVQLDPVSSDGKSEVDVLGKCLSTKSEDFGNHNIIIIMTAQTLVVHSLQ